MPRCWCESCIAGPKGAANAPQSRATFVPATCALKRAHTPVHALPRLPDAGRHHGAGAQVRARRPRRAGALGRHARAENAAQRDGGLRADRTRGPDACASALWHRHGAGRQSRGGGDRGADRRDAIRHAVAVSQGYRPGAAQSDDRGATIRAFCHTSAQPGADDAARARRLHNGLAQCPRCRHRARPVRLRRLRRAPGPLARDAGWWDARRGRVPALRAGAGGGRPSWPRARAQRSRAASR